MKKTLTEDFQATVLKFHIWNKSILDILMRLAKVNIHIEFIPFQQGNVNR